jgi:hypothetical protein
LVSEKWVVNANDQWEITQWIFNSTLTGEMREISNNFLLERKDGRVLDYKNLPTDGPQAETSQKLWAEKVNFWTEKTK